MLVPIVDVVASIELYVLTLTFNVQQCKSFDICCTDGVTLLLKYLKCNVFETQSTHGTSAVLFNLLTICSGPRAQRKTHFTESNKTNDLPDEYNFT